MVNSPRDDLKQISHLRRGEVVEILLRLLAIPSENPPADTRRIAGEVSTILQSVGGIDVELVSRTPPITNVVAAVRGRSSGRRVIFSGHMDTFKTSDNLAWSAKPTGELTQHRVYGCGAGDMKGGVAAQIFAALCLAEFREHFEGELVLAFTGDEQSGGDHGAAHLLDQTALIRGDAMICADAGSPGILHFGEKGTIWMTIEAEGKAGHGAHTHLTINAIDRLVDAISALKNLEEMPVEIPKQIAEEIEHAASVSEEVNGKGQTQVLRSITVNVGKVSGGARCNLAADHASAMVDIRFPPGLTLDVMQHEITARLSNLPGISFQIDYSLDVNFSSPQEEIVKIVAQSSNEIVGSRPVATMRLGSSDAALFRSKGIPSVNCGLTAYNMGDADEYVEVSELQHLARIYVLAAFDYLSMAPG